MSFYVFLLAGALGGLLGGMGMGGGTALIPVLVLLCGVEQGAAQGVNLLSFVPMALVALSVHARQGLVKWRAVLSFALPALLFSALFSLASDLLPSAVLKAAFGVFLTALSLVRLKRAISAPSPRPKSENFHQNMKNS